MPKKKKIRKAQISLPKENKTKVQLILQECGKTCTLPPGGTELKGIEQRLNKWKDRFFVGGKRELAQLHGRSPGAI